MTASRPDRTALVLWIARTENGNELGLAIAEIY